MGLRSAAGFAAVTLLGVACGLGALPACGGAVAEGNTTPDDTSKTPRTATDLPTPVEGPELTALTFGKCPKGYDGDGCATLDVPLDWTNRNGKTISILVVRSLATKPTATGKRPPQLWMLQGGPGGSGADMAALFEDLHADRPDLDLYTLDHRGVGASARLGCLQEEALSSDEGLAVTSSEWSDCLTDVKKKWGEGLKAFTTTNAARDLAMAVARTRQPDQEFFVYGVSYGTYLAERFLQASATPPTGVILDSVVSPVAPSIVDFDDHFDPVAQAIAVDCASNPSCREHLGPNPWLQMREVLASYATSKCRRELGMTPRELGGLLGNMLMFGQLNAYVPAVVFRVGRCDTLDVVAVKQLANVFGQLGPGSDPRFSQVLYQNVVFGELFPETPPTRAQLQADVNALTIASGAMVEALDLYPEWPRYRRDSYVGRWPVTDVPLLIMNGTLDVQTPVVNARVMKTQYAGPHQTYVEVQRGNHGLILQSPVDGGRSNCGLTLMLQFLEDPKGNLDTSCATQVDPLDFEGDPQLNGALFGSYTMWGLPRVEKPSAPSEALRRFDRVRRLFRALPR